MMIMFQVTSTPNSGDLSSENSHEFVSRHSLDGKFVSKVGTRLSVIFLTSGNFTFVDHRIMQLMGYSPPELLGENEKMRNEC